MFLCNCSLIFFQYNDHKENRLTPNFHLLRVRTESRQAIKSKGSKSRANKRKYTLFCLVGSHCLTESRDLGGQPAKSRRCIL